jgi:hypothetical protein
MAEDSGAFKTNLRICAGFRHNIMIRAARGQDFARLKRPNRWPFEPAIFNNRAEALRVFSTRPDSQHLGGAAPANLSPPRSLMARNPFATR